MSGVLIFFVLNPMIILWTLTGIGFYIAYLAMDDKCGDIYDSWIILTFLTLSITNTILAVMQSIRIFKSMVGSI